MSSKRTARVVDLDAARAARAEATGDAPAIVFKGRTWQLPVELPWAFVEATSGETSRVMDAMHALLDTQWDEFAACHPTVADVTVIVEAIPSLYGLGDLGN